MYAVMQLKFDGSYIQSHYSEIIIRQFNSRQAAARLADKLNEKHGGEDPRKEIVSFIVKPVY